MQIKSIGFKNFRNFDEHITIPFVSPITFLVGPNNVGKSNVFRFLGLFFERKHAELDLELDFDTTRQKLVSVTVEFVQSALTDRAPKELVASDFLVKNSSSTFSIQYSFSREGQTPSFNLNSFDGILKSGYFESRDGFIRHYGQDNGGQVNVNDFGSRLNLASQFPATVFVPSQRQILEEGKMLPRFDPRVVPASSTLDSSHVVSQLASMDRPNGTAEQKKAQRERQRILNEFLTHCLEANEVRIEVPNDKSTIHIFINGIERPLSGVGTGIEQLLLIGMAISQFKDRLVMIDEPELHLHPRTQKLMMQFLAHQTAGRFLVATHSSSILDAVESDIVSISDNAGKAVGNFIQNRNDRFQSIRNLGHSASELVQSNYVIWVEGPSDRIYLNHLIHLASKDDALVEGIDYSIIMYGGSILASHSFEDTSEDFFKALSISRQFAVYADSDKADASSTLKNRVERVSEETQKSGGYIWVSAGREIENYIPASIVQELVEEFTGVSVPANEFDRVLNEVDKVKFAKRVVALWKDEWPLDLEARIEDLIMRIKAAR